MEVLGVDLDGNVRAWERDQRRVGSLLALGVAALVVVAALVAYYAFDVSASAVYWALLAVAVLALLFQVALHVAQAPRAAAASSGSAAAGDGYVPTYSRGGPEPEAPRARALTLRCGDCGTVFELTDTGERPLYHACPGCGAEGVLRDPAPAPAPAAAPEAYAPPAAAPVKRLKLRCGGCKEVFSIEDTGERPLRRPCPYCARMGEVR